MRRPASIRNIATIRSLAWLALTAGVTAALAGEDIGRCRMTPPAVSIPIPASGLHWAGGYEMSGACEPIPDTAWTGTPVAGQTLRVHADGPSGSGRLWHITVGVARNETESPRRGFCLTTSTLGWRTLQRFQGRPLPWVEDVDGDGQPELILWDSFALAHEPGSAGEYALVAWVYQSRTGDVVTLDWAATRNMASRIAAAYREPLDGAAARVRALRETASRALVQFVSEECGPRGE